MKTETNGFRSFIVVFVASFLESVLFDNFVRSYSE
jgi:hypothetical protein